LNSAWGKKKGGEKKKKRKKEPVWCMTLLPFPCLKIGRPVGASRQGKGKPRKWGRKKRKEAECAFFRVRQRPGKGKKETYMGGKRKSRGTGGRKKEKR